MDNKEKLLTLIDRYINKDGVSFYNVYTHNACVYEKKQGVSFRRFKSNDYFRHLDVNNTNDRNVRFAIQDDVDKFVDERVREFRELHKDSTGIDSEGFEFNEIVIKFKEGEPNLRICGKTETVKSDYENLKIDLKGKVYSSSWEKFWKNIPKEAEFDISIEYYKIKGYKMFFGEIEVDLTIEEADDIYFKILDLSEGSRLRNSELALNQRLDIYGE